LRRLASIIKAAIQSDVFVLRFWIAELPLAIDLRPTFCRTQLGAPKHVTLSAQARVCLSRSDVNTPITLKQLALSDWKALQALPI
jgi:hypothetical protein